VKHPVFAIILALCQARIITNPIRQLYSLAYCAYSCLIGLVIIWTRLRAMNLAKSLIVPEKNFFNHRAPMQWNGSFWPKISPNPTFRQAWLIRYSRTKHAVHSYLRNRTTAQIEYVYVVLLIICWNFEYVNSLSLRDTHRFKKSKYWNIAHFCSEKRKISFRWVHPGSLIRLLRDKEGSERKPKYGIELPTSIKIYLVVSVVNLGEN
jgi:hypothetical protein